ncbi:MAG: hypothetical protein LUH45_00430, partial [Clostridiales bacterium]|nr:hypothetical protein [Clostridiales bacterium]
MYELTNETVAGRKYYAKLELNDGTVLTNYGDDAVGITSFSLSQTLCGSESVSIGCVNAACATIILEAGTALENQRFTLYLGQEFDGAVEWVPMGIFTGTKAEVSEGKLTVEAWDDLYFAGGDYTPSDSVTGECTIAAALADVCNGAGLTFSGEVPSLTVAGMPTGLTCSAAIGYLAALCGANACMDRDGCLVFRQFAESGQVLGTDDCYSGGMVFKTSDFTVASLSNTLETETTDDDGEATTETAEVERTTGAAGGSIALTNPLMTEDNIDTAWDVVKGLTYRPATLTAVGQLAVDVGDMLRVPTLIGERNLLPGTRDFSDIVSSTCITEDTYQGLTIVYRDRTDADTSAFLDICRWDDVITPEPDTYYTLSFWAKGTGEIRSFFFPRTVASGENDSGNTTRSSDGNIVTTLNEDWTRHWIT